MSIGAFAKNQLQLARCIGREDYSGAIRVLESSLLNNDADIPYLEMIARCHHWSQQHDKAVATIQQVHAKAPPYVKRLTQKCRA
jgi:hypothetical protein